MKKLLLILLCLPMLYSCGGNLDKEITMDMILAGDGYTGKGTFNSLGSKYVGEFKDSKAHGYGTFTWDNGSKYVGEWKDDKRNGQGTHTYADGTIEKGLWKNGKFIGQ